MGVKLGRLHALTASESGGQPPPMAYSMARSKTMDAVEQGYQPGELTFTASVSVEFDLP